MSILFLDYIRGPTIFPTAKNDFQNLSFEKESRYIKIVKFGLKITGLWKSHMDQSLNIPLVVLMHCLFFTALASTTHHLLFDHHDLNKVTELMMHIFLIAHTIFIHFTLAWKQQAILKMLYLVENRFDGFTDKFFKHNPLREEEKNNVTRTITMAAIISSVHLSFIITSKVYMVNLPPEQKSLLYPATVPFEMTNTVYYIVYSLQLTTTFFEGITHITSIAIFTGFMNIVSADFIALGKAFKHMGQLGRWRTLQCSGTEVVPGWSPEVHLDYHTRALLRTLVDHHILITNFYKTLQATFAIPILEMFLNCQIMLCSCCFHIFKATKSTKETVEKKSCQCNPTRYFNYKSGFFFLYQEREFEQVSKQMCMFIALLAHEFVYFWFGSRLTEKVERFCYDVYACDWHERSPSFKRSYRIVLERIKQKVTIQAFFLPVNLITFAKGLQAAFSYFNLLLALSYKQDKMLNHLAAQ